MLRYSMSSPLLYLIQLPDSVKIGRTANPARRLREYRQSDFTSTFGPVLNHFRAEKDLIAHFDSLHLERLGYERYLIPVERAKEIFLSYCEGRAHTVAVTEMVRDFPDSDFDVFVSSLSFNQQEAISFVKWSDMAKIWSDVKGVSLLESNAYKNQLVGSPAILSRSEKYRK